MGYWSYYLAWTLIAYAMRQPWLLVGVLVFLALRRLIPDPGALFRALSRSGALRTQVELNPANVTARRDLAQIYLDVLRPGAALKLVEQALARTPNEPELLYLAGLALHRVGRHEEALPKLVRAVELDPRVRFGQPYLVAGDALFALGRYEQAVDAYDRYLETNSSDVAGHLRAARAHGRLGDHAAARAAVDEARSTWRSLPQGMKRRGFFRGSLGPFWARIVVLKDPTAILIAVLLALAAAGASVSLYPAVAKMLTSPRMVARSDGESLGESDPLFSAFERCGSQSTGAFAGQYVALAPTPPAAHSSVTSVQRLAVAELEQRRTQQLENFEISSDRIRSGVMPIQEFCLTRTIESTPDRLRAEAIWQEDVNDPGDASLIELRLTRDGENVRVSVADPNGNDETEVAIVRRKN
jgi:tetratricopeptide (TPR) repeat protein